MWGSIKGSLLLEWDKVLVRALCFGEDQGRTHNFMRGDGDEGKDRILTSKELPGIKSLDISMPLTGKGDVGQTSSFRALIPGAQFQPDFQRHRAVPKISLLRKGVEKVLQGLRGEEGSTASPTFTTREKEVQAPGSSWRGSNNHKSQNLGILC